MERRRSPHSRSPRATQPVAGTPAMLSPRALSPAKSLTSSAQGAKRISRPGSHQALDQPR